MAADFYIAGIRKDKSTGHIQQLQVIKAGTKKTLITDREFVARLISLKHTTFQTIFLVKNEWRYGAMVHVFDDIFLATNANAKLEDNLESLPIF